MSTKIDYPPVEWAKLKRGPIIAGMYIMSASPSGSTGMGQEVTAIKQAIADIFKQVTPDSLLSSLIAELIGTARQNQGAADQIIAAVKDDIRNDPQNTRYLDDLREAVALVSAKGTPEEVAAYKDVVKTVARRVAEAAKEGTLLGLGGELVSPSEQAALDQLNEALA